MKLEFSRVESPGDPERERIVFRAAEDVDIGRFAVFQCEGRDNGQVASGPIASAYWFADKKIASGDFVVLYSKNGTTSEKTEQAITSHFFYWRSSKPLWVGRYVPVLINTASWEFGKVVAAELQKNAAG
jgi:hypothetical protein